jgi:glycosyltransferase involved in cell wall biosynthesis
MSRLFSIVIPTFNSREFVDECVASALGQTYSNIEVVVDDNASKDGTPQLLKEHFSKDVRLKIFENQEDLNIPLGWSRAMAHASGDYKLLLHSDNLLHPRYVETVARQIEKFPAEVIYSECIYFDGSTPKDLFDQSLPDRSFSFSFLSKGSRAIDYIFRFQRMIPTSCVSIATACFETRPAYLPEYRWDPDIEQMVWLAERYNVLHLNLPLVAIRTHPGQAASWKDKTFSRQYRELLELTQQRGKAEPHHFMIHWAYSNLDVCQRLSGLKKSTFAAYRRFLVVWFKAEVSLFAHFTINFARKTKMMIQYTFRFWTRKLRSP